jgi:flagellar hook protein FlgE
MSFQTGLSGLNAASRNLDVIGNNIANANTIGMKSSRAEFADLVASSIGVYGGGGAGIGVEVANISQQFTQGNISITGNNLDVAINGDGFFQVETPSGSTAYTRDGSFKLDNTGQIVTNSNAKVLGVTADPVTGAILAGGQVGPLMLPAGGEIPAIATKEIQAGINLDARAAIATGTAPAGLTPALETYGTTVIAYDQQGLEIPVNLYLVKTANNTWQAYTNVNGTTNTGTPATLGPPLVFGATGQLASTSAWNTPQAIPMFSVAAGAALAPAPTLDLSNLTQFGSNFGITKLTQDGQTSGKLTEVTIDPSGTIQGKYSNGKTVAAGQLQLATFTNVQGLEAVGGNMWIRTTASGAPSASGAPGSGNLGNLRAGALEESNVDLTAELVNMMTAQRAYQANAQTIKTQDQVMSTLVNLR